MVHKTKGKSNEWYTPKYIFKALDVQFDLDVAHPKQKTYVPAENFITENSLEIEWTGFIWMNPPWCLTSEKNLWLDKFIKHGNGICLMPDSTSAKWFKKILHSSDIALLMNNRVCFIRPDGTKGSQPANGTTLFGIGNKAINAIINAENNNLGTSIIRAEQILKFLKP